MAITPDEAVVIMDKGLCVHVSQKLKAKHGEGPFYITSIMRYKHIDDISGGFTYSAGITTNGRCVCTADLHELTIASKWKSNVDKFVKIYKRDRLKALLSDMLAADGRKTAIIEYIKKIIDEIKKEQSDTAA